LNTQRQDEQFEAEQAAGRRALARYAQRNGDAAAARERIRAEGGNKEDTAPGLSGFKT